MPPLEAREGGDRDVRVPLGSRHQRSQQLLVNDTGQLQEGPEQLDRTLPSAAPPPQTPPIT